MYPLAMATILIVSSDSPVGQSVSQHLLAKGYDVVTAASATEGLRTLHNLDVDAIALPLLFLVSPTQRWLPSSVPLRIGRDALVSKPFRPEELEEAFQPLLGATSVAASRTLSAGSLSPRHRSHPRAQPAGQDPPHDRWSGDSSCSAATGLSPGRLSVPAGAP
jgi:DNA-binding response OmpR family regulator